MKKYLLISTLLLNLNISAYALTTPNLEGSYDCKGTEIGTNEKYNCKTTLVKTKQTYALKSVCDDGTSYIGTGIYDAKKHNFSLVFINPKRSEETGVIVADVKKDLAMTSTWTYLNQSITGHGSCIKLKDKTSQNS